MVGVAGKDAVVQLHADEAQTHQEADAQLAGRSDSPHMELAEVQQREEVPPLLPRLLGSILPSSTGTQPILSAEPVHSLWHL